MLPERSNFQVILVLISFTKCRHFETLSSIIESRELSFAECISQLSEPDRKPAKSVQLQGREQILSIMESSESIFLVGQHSLGNDKCSSNRSGSLAVEHIMLLNAQYESIGDRNEGLYYPPWLLLFQFIINSLQSTLPSPKSTKSQTLFPANQFLPLQETNTYSS